MSSSYTKYNMNSEKNLRPLSTWPGQESQGFASSKGGKNVSEILLRIEQLSLHFDVVKIDLVT